MNGATPPSSFADPGTKPLQNSIRLNKQDGPVDRKLHRRKSSISHFAVVSVRGRLSEDEQKAASDEMINQFLRATGGDFELVSDMSRLRPGHLLWCPPALVGPWRLLCGFGKGSPYHIPWQLSSQALLAGSQRCQQKSQLTGACMKARLCMSRH